MEQTTLIQSAQNGDLEAFNQLVLMLQDRLFNVAARMLDDDDSAADAVQNAFILAFRNLSKFRGTSFDFWLLRILKNVCFDELRRRKRHIIFPIDPPADDDEGFETSIWLVDHSQNPADMAERADLTRAIQAGLKTLAPEFRMVLVLVDVDGLDYAQVASVIGVPVGTVKSRLARARMRLRQELQRSQELLPRYFFPSRTSMRADAMAAG